MVNTIRYYDIFSRQKADWIFQAELLKGKKDLEVNEFCLDLGFISVNHFVNAYAYMIERHESLRTIFPVVDEMIRQQILPYEDALFGLRVQEGYGGMDEAKAEISRSFSNLCKGPLSMGFLFSDSSKGCRFYFACHHIISDAFSLSIFRDELMIAYKALHEHRDIPLSPSPFQLKDYLQQELNLLGGTYGDQLYGYWNDKLDQYLVPVDHAKFYQRLTNNSPAEGKLVSGKAAIAAGTWYRYTTITKKKDRILKEAAAHRVSGPSLLLTSFFLTAHLCFDIERFLAISTVSGRLNKSSKRVIGNLACNALLKSELSQSGRLKDLLMPSYLEFLQACRYPIFNFDRIGNFNLRKDCEFYVNFLDFDKSKTIGAGEEHLNCHVLHKGFYSLAFTICEYTDGYSFRYCYQREIYSDTIMEKFSQLHLRILSFFLEQPDTPVDSLYDVLLKS